MKTQTTHNVTTLKPAEIGIYRWCPGSQNANTGLVDAINVHTATRRIRNLASLATKFRNMLVLAALMVTLANVASASIAQDLTISLSNPQCHLSVCGVDPGNAGSPASGAADFTDLGYPYWSFSFLTGPADSWSQVGGSYSAGFSSGSIDITGPFGLTFNGNLTHGDSQESLAGEHAGVEFTGYWSNGLYGYGDAEVFITLGQGASADFDITTVAPEPGSLIMFGSGILGLAGMLRRRLMG